jgi:bacteriophage protein of unknown function (DUF646)
MGIDIEAEGLSGFSQELLDLATKDFPKDTKNFLQRAGNKLKANAKNNYKSGTTQGTKNLIKGLKRDRAYKYGKDEWQVRVKNTAPHAWLVEHGHVMLGHSAQGKPKLIVGNTGEAFVRGKNVMGKTAKAFPSEYQGLAEEFIDKMLNEKGLG